MITKIKDLKSKANLFVKRDKDGNTVDIKSGPNPFGSQLVNGRYVPIDPKSKGFDKVSPFIFEASFKVIGSSNTYSRDIIRVEFLNPPAGTNPFVTYIDAHNFAEIFKLLAEKRPNFSVVMENDEFIGFKGIWKFDFSKKTMCIAPYTEEL